MDYDFQSLSRGVFVVPFSPSEVEAGPSKPKRPFRRIYEESYRHYEEAYQTYEADRSEFQLEEITHWLDSLSQPSLLKPVSGTNRLPVAVIQNIAGDVSSKLYQCTERAFTLDTRDAIDLSSALRNVALGLIGEPGTGKKSGKSPMDELEAWYALQKRKPEILLHIQQAQSVLPSVLAELLYIIAIRPNLKLRVLLSVSSSSLFLSSWTHVEPSLVDLTVIQSGKGSKRGGAVNAILQCGRGKDSVVFGISDNMAEELKRMEGLTGTGPAGALKALKWSLLHHSFNSPFSRIAEEYPEHVQAIVTAKTQGIDDIPGGHLLQLQLHPDLVSTIDPAPRLSILHGLAQPQAFVNDVPRDREPNDVSTGSAHRPADPPSRKRKRTVASTNVEPQTELPKEANNTAGGDLKELETLFNLWRSAGRNINLWDWLEGFRDAFTQSEEDEAQHGEVQGNGIAAEPVTPRPLRTRRHKEEEQRENVDGQEREPEEMSTEEKDIDADTQDRLHATFIRFCEEARMMGLVRARGGRTSKRADEVIKSINFI